MFGTIFGRRHFNERSSKVSFLLPAGGFIGGNLIADLRARGHKRIRAVDIKPLDEWYRRSTTLRIFRSI